MDNGHDKLVAKVQHFYDMLVKKYEQYSELSISAENLDDRKIHVRYADEYNLIAAFYKDIFEDFLYNGETTHQ